MNKIKVIDLLNMISKGEEVPKKIQVYSDIFVFDDSNKVYEHEETRTNLLSIYNGNILNYEVKIKEEDKKIEKLEIYYDNDLYEYIVETYINGVNYKEIFKSKYDEMMINKANEIIKVLNEMREDK